MLPKNKRIPRELFKYLLEQKRYFNSEHFTLMVGGEDEPIARISATVSKKISKLAVIRNTIRRRVYAGSRSFIYKLKPGLYLVVAKKGADKIRGEALEVELENLFSSAGVVSGSKKG